MSRIRGLELLFNLEKKNFKSQEDCVVAVFHCILINENFQCVGIGDTWPDSNPNSTELLPKDWNSIQDVYSLRYITKDNKTRIFLKVIKVEDILQVDLVENEDAIASMAVPVNNYISDDYTEYSTAYKDLESLSESFHKDVLKNLKPMKEKQKVNELNQKILGKSIRNPSASARPQSSLLQERRPNRFGIPPVGGSDLNPFDIGGGGMFMDPSGFGIPGRPSLPRFGGEDPYGLPRGAVPPGARFDPFGPPHLPNRFIPQPDDFRPPNNDDYFL